jgi:hypothetical protein
MVLMRLTTALLPDEVQSEHDLIQSNVEVARPLPTLSLWDWTSPGKEAVVRLMATSSVIDTEDAARAVRALIPIIADVTIAAADLSASAQITMRARNSPR